MESSAKLIKFTIAISAIIRIFTSFALSNEILTHVFGLGIPPAIKASILDPRHTWDDLDEACFLLKNGVSQWGDENGKPITGYRAIYVPGSRIVAPPLVVAFLGEMFASYKSSNMLWMFQRMLLLLADAIGAYCIYQIGKRVYEMERDSVEAEIERVTKNCELKNACNNTDMTIPGKLRPSCGWMFGLSTRVLDDFVKDSSSDHVNSNLVREDHNSSHTKLDKALSRQNTHREPILTLIQVPTLVSLLYLSNPVSMIANSTGSLRSLWDASALISLYYATKPSNKISNEGIPIKIKSASSAAAFLALATYVDAGYVMFLVPTLLWRGMLRGHHLSSMKYKRGQNNDWKAVLSLYFCYTMGLHWLASLLVGGNSNEYKKVMIQTILPNIAFFEQDRSGSVPGPSMGLHWYFFVQMFDRFRPYFTVYVAGVPAMFVIPLTIRLHRYPSVLTATFSLLWSIFRPTTTIHTLTLGLHLAMLNPRTIIRMSNSSLISLFSLPVPILLFITFHRMWLVTGNGNPNYIYFQCFAYGLFIAVITLDFVSATVKRDKVLRMVEKGDTLVKQDTGGKVEDVPDSKSGKGVIEVVGGEAEIIDDDLNKSDKGEEKPAVVFL